MFLYIFEDGAIAKTKSPPTSDDLDCIKDGILEVLVVGDDADRIDDVGMLCTIPPAILMTHEHMKFHVPGA